MLLLCLVFTLLFNLVGKSFGDCCDACNKNPACESFTMQGNAWCWLKSVAAEEAKMNDYSGMISGFKNGGFIQPNTLTCGKKFDNKNIIGGDIGGVGGSVFYCYFCVLSLLYYLIL